MSELHVTAYFTIHDGKGDEFKSLADKCIERVRETEAPTYHYNWYFNEDSTKCVVSEAYKDSDGLLAHLGNLGELFPALLAISDFSVEVCGNPSAELVAATEGMDVTAYGYYAGAWEGAAAK